MRMGTADSVSFLDESVRPCLMGTYRNSLTSKQDEWDGRLILELTCPVSCFSGTVHYSSAKERSPGPGPAFTIPV